MYTPAPSASELASFGFLPEDFANDFVFVWPEHRQAFDVFCAMQTQWRMGGGGMGGSVQTGLDYPALLAVMQLLDVPEADRVQVFADVRVMEGAALDAMAEARKKAAQ